MKHYFINLILLFLLISCDKDGYDCEQKLSFTENLKNLVAHYVDKGIPGVVVKVVNKDHGSFTLSGGFADRENEIALDTSHLFHSASVAKLYIAASILMLYDENKLKLDDKLSVHLSSSILKNIANAEDATLRTLLNHRSGIADFGDDPGYKVDLEEYLLKGNNRLKPILDYIRGDKSTQGNDAGFKYSNSGYHLLALVIESASGSPHEDFITNRIIGRLNLKNTFYKNELNYPSPNGLPKYYVDWDSNGKLTDAKNLESDLISTTIGINGIIASVNDYYLFAKAFYESNTLISENAKKEMLSTIHINEFGYGLGQEIMLSNDYPDRFGHSGGPQSLIAYYPEKSTFILFFQNYSFLEANSPIDKLTTPHLGVGKKGVLLGDIERCIFE